MGLFEKLFKPKKLRTIDPDFGEVECFSTNGSKVGWQVNRTFLGAEIEILLEGTTDGISVTQKNIILNALNDEIEIKSESEKALKQQFENADLEFLSISQHFDPKGISVWDDGFQLTFQEKQTPRYFFNVHFENNKQVGVSIDG